MPRAKKGFQQEKTYSASEEGLLGWGDTFWANKKPGASVVKHLPPGKRAT